jgi:uncharacterized protein (TIGR03083 family)
VDIAELIDHVEAEGLALGDAAAVADLDAAIPRCDDWTVRGLLGHVGEVHRWAATIVGTARDNPAVPAPDVPGDAELVEWFRAGHRGLVDTLRAAPADLDCWFFLEAPSALAFWARRQALETAVHRVDAEGASGQVRPIDSGLAADGMGELLLGFGARKKAFEPATVRLAPADAAPWHVTLGPDGLTATADDPGTPTDVTVSGSASDVYLWMWNRTSAATIAGDPALAAEWQKFAVRWS